VITSLFKTPSSSPNTTAPNLIWCAFFTSLQSVQKPQEEIPKNIFLVPDAEGAISAAHAVEQAEKIFKKMYPEEIFMEQVPDPNDIIYEAEQNTNEEVQNADGEKEATG